MIKHLIFDFDGTLIELVEAHYVVLNAAIEKIAGSQYIINRDEQDRQYNGLSTKTKLKKLVAEKNLPEKYLEDINREKQKLTLQYIDNNISVNDTLVSDLTKLKNEGFKLHCASNAMFDTVSLGLKKLGVFHLFDEIIGNNHIKRQKPFPDIYLQCFLLIEAEPGECLIIEDSHHGRVSAIKSGAYLCEVDTPNDTTYEHIKSCITKIEPKLIKFAGKHTLNLLVPMGGAGSRMRAKYLAPKPLIDIAGKPMIQRVVESLNIDANYIFIVQKEHYEQYNLGSYLNLIAPGCTVLQTDGLTDGAACTSLLAKEFINNSKHLLIANSDQLLDWNSSEFMHHMLASKADGGILTLIKNNDPKWSYVKLNEYGYAVEVAEKNPISNKATVGLYYFNKGSDYIKAAEEMISVNDRTNNEFYIAPTYNYLIKQNKKILTFDIDETQFHPTGTIEDLEKALQLF